MRKLKFSISSTTSPLHKTVIIENSEVISAVVNLFENPLMTIASKTFMHAHINNKPRSNVANIKSTEVPAIAMKVIVADCPTVA